MMDLDGDHPSSAVFLPTADMHTAIAHETNPEHDLSDTDLSQFQAEIEQNLSSASVGNSPPNGTTDHVSEDAMDVESEEEVKPMHVNKAHKRTTTREYYDPELFGLRRSVNRSNSQPSLSVRFEDQILIQLGTYTNRA
jgi:hypothetical protein